ncbi:hypothetical protein P879_02950 [Paragonimus westermani]|uniref:DDE-1 domain-containing protein n=1 Tax=Paragonimus westermani TaxID=34504 RepID=A0A8T0DC79_9TREM|nr:hypothetical protein P879_02950 [Paragonimus westermani]
MDPVAVEEDYSGSDEALDADDREEDSVMLHTSGAYDYQQQILFYPNFDSVTGRSLQRPKTRRRRWTQRDMTNAYNAVKYQGMSLRGAATAFNVPESTLRDRVHGRVSLECSRPGPPTFFTYEEEKKMVDHILFMSKIGYPYTRNQVVELAGDMTKAVGRIAPFKYINPSQAWFYAFLNRWPDLKNFLFGPRSNRKSKGVSGDSIQSYFEQLEKVLNKYGIKDKAEHFWIVDEVSISCENQPPRILPISIQRAQSVSYWNPTVAMLGAANGAGAKIPPFLIYRGDCITPSMMEGSVRGTKFSYSTSGWVNSDAFIQWFLKHFRILVPLRPLILFYDGHLQFVSVRVLERAREDDVFLFPLPPHPAYNHCVENTCFWAFQAYFKKRLDRFFEQNRSQPLIRTNVAPVLTHAYEKALQPSNVVLLFERLGICPFNNLSTSIGAYINMADDYDQVGFVGENMDMSYDVYSQSNWIKASTTPNYMYPTPVHVPSLTNGDLKEAPLATVGSVYPATNHIQESTPFQSTATQYVVPASSIDAKPHHAVVTGLAPSGRSVTIRLHGPAAGAIHPVNRSAGETSVPAVVTTANLSSATVVLTNKLSTTVSNSEDGVTHSDVDIAHEEEIGFDGPQASLSTATQLGCGVDSLGHTAVEQAMTDTTEFIEEIEDGEAPDFCVVCGQLEPPESACQPTSDLEGADDLQVVDWVHCDFCNRWVHWNGSCSEGAVIGNNAFMCIVCRHNGTTGTRQQDQCAVISAATTCSYSLPLAHQSTDPPASSVGV